MWKCFFYCETVWKISCRIRALQGRELTLLLLPDVICYIQFYRFSTEKFIFILISSWLLKLSDLICSKWKAEIMSLVAKSISAPAFPEKKKKLTHDNIRKCAGRVSLALMTPYGQFNISQWTCSIETAIETEK